MLYFIFYKKSRRITEKKQQHTELKQKIKSAVLFDLQLLISQHRVSGPPVHTGFRQVYWSCAKPNKIRGDFPSTQKKCLLQTNEPALDFNTVCSNESYPILSVGGTTWISQNTSVGTNSMAHSLHKIGTKSPPMSGNWCYSSGTRPWFHPNPAN